jgi:hypothetical protein
MDDYKNHRLERYLKDIIRWYEDQLPKWAPESDMHRMLEDGYVNSKETLALLKVRMGKQ